ncbi:response regulator [Altererythrobacter indicus]|uniref:histidine kinase n=1 Tax=Altericroceibacterium indicum TaxID=374177 RepID=A0A845A5E0_9SPHN|nr:PAS domain-containing sensor histidine kinase [Altericroceibacterium indicum]MXP24777.1 response regulator [Altericroceibacterium indicum]
MSILADSGQPRMTDAVIVILAVLVSVILVFIVTDSTLVTVTFTGGLAVLGVGGAAILRRISPQKHAAAELIDWSVTLEAMQQDDRAVVITDRCGRMVCANALYESWFGSNYTPPYLPIADERQEELARLARIAWRDGADGGLVISADKGEWQVEAQRAGRGDEYLVWRFVSTAKDDPVAVISARLNDSFGEMMSYAGIELAVVDTEGFIQAVSPGFARRACGGNAASLIGRDFVSLLRTDERDRIYYSREGREGSPQTLVQVPLFDPADSSVDPVKAPSLMLMLDSGVGLGGWGGGNTGQAPQLESLLEHLPLGLALTDRDGHFLFANPAFHRAAGIEKMDLPLYPSDLVIQEDKAAISDAVRRYGQGVVNSGDMAIRLRSQPDEPVSLRLAGIRGLGEPAVLLSLADTTVENRLRRQVAQATKMQAVGQLAGGVAHDFNNVLTAIIGYCDLMLLRHIPGDSDYDDIQQIKANSNRAASLTRQLLAFSRQQTLQPEVLQLPDVISEVSQLLKRLLGAKITLETHHDRDLGPVRADPRQLEQVIINLAVNARDAIQSRDGGSEHGTGTLSFSTRCVSAADIRRMRSDIIPIGDYTVLIAEDTGGGIPAEYLPKIFEPFFTTKELGKGTGLGLSTVYGIVKQSGGFIFVDNFTSKDGRSQGARFSIYLPVYRGESGGEVLASGPEVEPTSSWSGGGRILLVEDEDMVRAVAERSLTRQGYTVVSAEDGDQGLELVRSDGPFDLVVSDVVMPTMDGPAMAREIRKIASDLPVLFMSGYAEEQLRREIKIDGMYFIPKPFSVKQIAAKVTQILRSSHNQAD